MQHVDIENEGVLDLESLMKTFPHIYNLLSANFSLEHVTQLNTFQLRPLFPTVQELTALIAELPKAVGNMIFLLF